MRMWGVEPRLLCKKHLLGEHVEMHMFVGHLNKGRQLGKYLDGLVQRELVRERHDRLADEISRRGYKHGSPLPDYDRRPEGWIDARENLKELARRCPGCRTRQRLASVGRTRTPSHR